MVEKDGQYDLKKNNRLRVTKFSRRQFLKGAVVAAVGTTIVYLPTACQSPSTSPESSSESPTIPSTNISTTTSNPPLVTDTKSPYVPPSAYPPVITVTGTSCTVATDRLYSQDHVWVLSLSNNRVVMGISQTMYEILYRPYRVSVSPVGTKLSKGDTFSVMEGYKMAADIVSPVSGTIVDRNELAVGFMGEDGAIQALCDSYKSGWVVVVQLSKPEELSSLLSANEYVKLVAGK